MSPSTTSVVVDDFNVISVSILKAKADAPLVVDPDAIRTTSITLQSFKPIPRRYVQGTETISNVKLHQFALGKSLQIYELPNSIPPKNRLVSLIWKHRIIPCNVVHINVWRQATILQSLGRFDWRQLLL